MTEPKAKPTAAGRLLAAAVSVLAATVLVLEIFRVVWSPEPHLLLVLLVKPGVYMGELIGRVLRLPNNPYYPWILFFGCNIVFWSVALYLCWRGVAHLIRLLWARGGRRTQGERG
jgi:hypothetical protein